MGKKFGKTAVSLVLALAISGLMQISALAADLIPVGKAVGIRVTIDGVMVAGISEVETAEGKCSPAAQSGVLPGDIIVKLGSEEVHCLEEFSGAAKQLTDDPISLTVLREGERKQFTITPVLAADGRHQLGLWLRDGITGIGTVTYYDPETGVYGALGHGINDAETGNLIPVTKGEIYDASVVGVVKGRAGAPGELTGNFDGGNVCGTVGENTVFGIFGSYEGASDSWGQVLESAEWGEVRPGKATILSTVNGTQTQPYEISIDRVYREGNEERFLISVTDPKLLETTGGIVQGMSGSPILQNGKLVGAVTHVLTNDPTRGYGIFIENMLEAAG